MSEANTKTNCSHSRQTDQADQSGQFQKAGVIQNFNNANTNYAEDQGTNRERSGLKAQCYQILEWDLHGVLHVCSVAPCAIIVEEARWDRPSCKTAA